MDDGGRRPRAAVVLTGSELVTGVIADANGSWLAHELTARGFEVAHLLVVGDRPDDLAEALRYCAAAGCVLVVTSGGLGPTADDLTGEVVAAFAGVELQFDEALRERIAAIVARFPRIDQDPDARDAGVRKQAWVPRGAVVLEPVGTAPGLVVATDRRPARHRPARAAARADGDVAERAGERAGAGAAGGGTGGGRAAAALLRAVRGGGGGDVARPGAGARPLRCRGDDLPAPFRAGGRPAAAARRRGRSTVARRAAGGAARETTRQRGRHEHRRAARPGAARPEPDRGHRRVVHRRVCWPAGWSTGRGRRPTCWAGSCRTRTRPRRRCSACRPG